MHAEDYLGRVVRLSVRRFGPPGAFLAVDVNEDVPGAPTILLPGAEVPEGTREGEELQVFVYLDSEDRPVATMRDPMLTLGEVGFVEVRDTTAFGSFVDWGMPKELLVPFAEQTCDMHLGELYPVGVFLDDTGRLAGTMRVSEMLKGKAEFELDEWVEGEAWRNEPAIGIFVIVEHRFVGLVPATEPTALSRGEAARFRITNVIADGKFELSLRGKAHEEIGNDADKILALLGRPGAPKISDRSSPEEIKDLLGLSKKAFKRAVGRLLKENVLYTNPEGALQRRR